MRFNSTTDAIPHSVCPSVRHTPAAWSEATVHCSSCGRADDGRTEDASLLKRTSLNKRHGDADQMPQMRHWRTLDAKGMLQEIEEGLKLGLPRTGRYLCWPPVSQTFQIMHRVSQNYCLLSCYLYHISRSATRNIGHMTTSKVQL